MTDWSAIRSEYEQGASLRDIVAQHGSSIATISRVARHEGWIRPVKPLQASELKQAMKQVKRETPLSPMPVSMPLDAVSIARAGLKQLAQHLQPESPDEILPIASHKSLSDALAQYVKVLITAPSETGTEDGLVIPLERLLPETRAKIRLLLAEDEHMQQERSAG